MKLCRRKLICFAKKLCFQGIKCKKPVHFRHKTNKIRYADLYCCSFLLLFFPPLVFVLVNDVHGQSKIKVSANRIPQKNSWICRVFAALWEGRLQMTSTLTTYLTPNTGLSTPRLKYCTQDKHTQLSSFAELSCHPIKSLAAVSLPEYVDTRSQLTGYLHL